MDITPAVDSADASARAAAAAEQAETSWTCATWNVLADGLAQGGGWLYAEDDVLQWQHRWPRVQQRLRALDADVVCLQEVNHFAECFAPFMASLGYAGAFMQKPKSPAQHAGKPADGTAVFWKRMRFAPAAAPFGCAFACPDGAPTNQGYVVVPLLHTASARHVTVIGVHLKAGATSEDRAARRQQAAQLRRRLQDPTAPPALPRALQHVGIDVAGEDASHDCARKVSASTTRCAAATVVLGDFNDLPTSAPLTTLMPENEKCACGRGSGGGLRVAGHDGDATSRKAVPRVAPQCGCTNCAAAPLRSCWDDYAGLLAAASAEGTAASEGCDVPLGEWLESGGGGGGGGACTDAIGDVFTT